MTEAPTPDKAKCPYCGEENFPESGFCWACYKNLETKGRTGGPEDRKTGSRENLFPAAPPIPRPSDSQNSRAKLYCYGRLALIAGLLIFYFQWIGKDHYFSFLDLINLAFHEAGHVFLGFFGRFIMMSGGTIFQLLFPVICGVHLWRQDSRIGWQLCVFWLGENLLNISIYAGDAITQALPLVGGGEHDWTYLLTATDLIAHTQDTARAIFVAGSLVIFWSLYLIGRDAAALWPVRSKE